MPRLTAEMISESPQFTNPVRDWELDLRGELFECYKSKSWLLCGCVCRGPVCSPVALTLTEEGNSQCAGLPALLYCVSSCHAF